jgi:hypothetical protein
MELRQVYTTPDGAQFDTKAEAIDYLRRPKILEALNGVTNNNKEVSDWLLENQEVVESAFDAGTVRRVTKPERKKLTKAFEALEEQGLEGHAAYLLETVVIDGEEHVIKDILIESFKWPKQSRLGDEEKLARAKQILAESSEGNEAFADWAVENQEAILEAYKAGIEKRTVSPKAQEALAKYREEMAKKKAEAEAAEAKGKKKAE